MRTASEAGRHAVHGAHDAGGSIRRGSRLRSGDPGRPLGQVRGRASAGAQRGAVARHGRPVRAGEPAVALPEISADEDASDGLDAELAVIGVEALPASPGVDDHARVAGRVAMAHGRAAARARGRCARRAAACASPPADATGPRRKSSRTTMRRSRLACVCERTGDGDDASSPSACSGRAGSDRATARWTAKAKRGDAREKR